MTEYLDAAHEAYNRLIWQQENRPPAEEIEELRKADIAENRRKRVAKFRRSIA